jgi:2-C-methyl-D-erythritol 2,4-cyclodiphosphate synthase
VKAHDAELAKPPEGWQPPLPRVGLGYDVHRLVARRRAGKPLILAGVEVASRRGPLAHSDGDTLIHALIDALLGAAALPDIGRQFPPTDAQYRNASSRLLLRQVADLTRREGFQPWNVDCVVLLERPRLAQYIPLMRSNLAADLGVTEQRVSVKAKTRERLGAVGRGRAVEAWAVVLLAAVPQATPPVSRGKPTRHA